MLFSVNKNPSTGELRKFGLVMLIGLGLIGGLIYWRASAPAAYVIWAIAVVVFAIEMAVPQPLGQAVYVGWMTIAAGMGRVMVPFFLTVMYFTFLAPFALIRVKDPLRKKLHSGGTYWEKHVNHEPTLERMRRPF
jgi:hypothetical protein